MPPTVKENEISTVKPESASRPAATGALPGESAIKQQPVALEVPVTVNGARTVEGSDKREPFSETTKTVLVFGNGAVIRLSSTVASGQLLFLTNEKTKKEVVCQVVKSKNYRNVSGYVELEFTESVVGFWGMRFPGDRIGSAPQPAAATPSAVNSPAASGSPVVPRPIAPKIEAPVVRDVAPKLSESKFVAPSVPVAQVPPPPKFEEPVLQKPVAPVSSLSSALTSSFDPAVSLKHPVPSPVKPVVPAAPVSIAPVVTATPVPVTPAVPETTFPDFPRSSESQASFLEPPKAPAAAPNLLSLFESKPAIPGAVPPPAPVAVNPETEALKQHTARLQEQLSTMLFSETPAPPATVSVQIPHTPPVVIQKQLAESAAKVLEQAHAPAPQPVPAKPVEPVKLDALPAKSSLADEELKIPAWLEPLARNAAAPASTQELIEREKAKRTAEQQSKVEEVAVDSLAAVEVLSVPELPLPTFDSALPLDTQSAPVESASRGSNKGLLFGAIAAGVLILVGGGWWYLQQKSSGASAAAAASSPKTQASVLDLPSEPSKSQPLGNTAAQTNPPAQATPVPQNASLVQNTKASQASPASTPLSVAPARNSQPSLSSENRSASASKSVEAEPAQAKKPVLGEVRLATPKASQRRSAQNGSEVDAGISLSAEQPDTSAEPLNSGLIAGSKQPAAPAAPVPVGGDVKQAKLIASVPPIYPTLAKSQHVSGNVQIDALIDATGRVTTMKVVSGPTLLHQAAMDALKQWKYQPASLDGKPVPMHLTVTVQFRLQ